MQPSDWPATTCKVTLLRYSRFHQETDAHFDGTEANLPQRCAVRRQVVGDGASLNRVNQWKVEVHK